MAPVKDTEWYTKAKASFRDLQGKSQNMQSSVCIVMLLSLLCLSSISFIRKRSEYNSNAPDVVPLPLVNADEKHNVQKEQRLVGSTNATGAPRLTPGWLQRHRSGCDTDEPIDDWRGSC